MAVTFLAGNRAVGTSAERLSTFTANPAGWVELGRTTLGASGDTIDVTNLSNKRYYMLLVNILGTGGHNRAWTVLGNGTFDTGSNYAQRYSQNGGSDNTNTSLNLGMGAPNLQVNTNIFDVRYISNFSTKEKLQQNFTCWQNTAGSGNAPHRSEQVGKWANTSNALDRIRMYNDDAGSFDTNSELVVLGYDPADTHTNNFWTEIGSGTGTGISDITLSASKKYNMFAGYIKATGGNIDLYWRAGSGSIDTGSNYARRRMVNGAADATNTTSSAGDIHVTAVSTPVFVWGYIINRSANEKLCMCWSVNQSTTGAGNTPNRQESVSKWANTSAQFDHFGIVELGAGSIESSSFLKIWGSD